MISYEYVFPIVDVDKQAENLTVAAAKDVRGTAFSIGGDIFLTAAHVLKDPVGTLKVGFPVKGIWNAVEVQDPEILEYLDLGIFKASVPNVKLLNWVFTELSIWDNVASVGFPYGLDTSIHSIVVRGLKGHVVCAKTSSRFSASPRIYELSFPCPRGISGAPVWLEGPSPTIAGLVLGNEITEMTVYSEKETDGSSYEKVEAFHLGIALQSMVILNVNSKLLGKTIGQHIANQSSITGGPTSA